ncbi:MAG: MltA domain-containing protein [Hyphomicrobiaceae bacterium]
MSGNVEKPQKRRAAAKAVRGKAAPVAFSPISFDEVPGWAEDDHLAALKAFQSSCPAVVAGKAGKATGADAAALVQACKAALSLPPRLTRRDARVFFEAHFQPQRATHDAGEGLMTGYYEPVIEGSRTRQGKFQTPLFKRPADLVTVVPETRAAAPGGLSHARRTAAGFAPFATRAEIDAGALAGRNLELLYLPTPVDVYFLQIQGAGRIRLTDGSVVRVQYDGKNGHPYTSIGRYLIDKGLLAADKMSMGALGRWLKADVARAREVMNKNASYVFFREMPADARGPHGAIDVPLIAGRSLAVDPSFHRLGAPVYVSAPTLTPKGHARPFNRLMIAHDVGGAIRGPERADIYFGTGEKAESQAGVVRHPGHLFALAPIATAAKPAARASAPPVR